MSKELGAESIAKASKLLTSKGTLLLSLKWQTEGAPAEIIKESRSIP